MGFSVIGHGVRRHDNCRVGLVDRQSTVDVGDVVVASLIVRIAECRGDHIAACIARGGVARAKERRGDPVAVQYTGDRSRFDGCRSIGLAVVVRCDR